MFEVKTFYLNQTLKTVAICNDISCVQMDGRYVAYFENGAKEEEGFRDKGKKIGTWKRWYDNAQLKESRTYNQQLKEEKWETWYKNGQHKEVGKTIGDWNDEAHLRDRMINFWDSTGNQTVENGNGDVIYFHQNGELISSIGQYKKGLKDGEWKSYTEQGKLIYQESYKNKKVKGVSWDSLGNEYRYSKLEEMPDLGGGMGAFYSHVGNTMKYPKNARRSGIQGRVYVQFVIDKDGRIIDAKVVKGIGGGCDEEALRVIQNSPQWNPGVQRGKPVKVRMVLPIIFRIG